MLKELFKKEKESLNHFFDNLDVDAAERLFQILKDCKGLIILTGVGKSGLVAEKISLTLTSTGTRAFFLSPATALHGDIGMVSKDDVFIMFSKSGESEELLCMVPYLRNKGVTIVAVVSQPNSRLSKAADLTVLLPMENELCPYNLVPTTSSTIQLIFGDVLSIALMTHKNFSVMEFAMNHPAGKIGRRLTIKVKDLMLKDNDLPLASPDDKLVDTLVELSNKRCGCMLVVDKHQELQGIFTDGDLRRALQNKGSSALESPLKDVMTLSPRHVDSSKMASEALELMEADQKRPITVLPVLEGGKKVVGLIKMHDILQSGL